MRPVLTPLLARSGEQLEFSVPLAALPIMALSALLLAGFVAAGMMMFASFARTFREGQSMITPFCLQLAVVVACTSAATFILRFEDVVMGSYSGGLAGFVRDRLLGRRRGAGPAAGSPA